MRKAIREIMEAHEDHARCGRKGLLDEKEARKLARRVLRQQVPICKALEEAGFAPRQARKGLNRVKHSRIMRKAFMEEKALILKEQEIEGPGLNPKQTEMLIVKRLKRNITSGKDKAVQSAKLLGSHKDLNLWIPETRAGVVIINAPGSGQIGDDLPLDEQAH